MRPNDKDGKPVPNASAVLDAVIDLVAEEEAENGQPTEQDIRWSRDLRAQMQSRIAALRRQLTPAQPGAPQGTPVGAEIRALDREGLLARLEAHRGGGDGNTRQDLADLSDDDLRQLLANLVGPTAGK
jgi:uncharacterized protein involved in exopolysaccharide biosynthesis